MCLIELLFLSTDSCIFFSIVVFNVLYVTLYKTHYKSISATSRKPMSTPVVILDVMHAVPAPVSLRPLPAPFSPVRKKFPLVFDKYIKAVFNCDRVGPKSVASLPNPSCCVPYGPPVSQRSEQAGSVCVQVVDCVCRECVCAGG